MILPTLLVMMFQLPMLDNDYLTVRMVTDQPHSEANTHRHVLDRVMIYLDDGRMQIKNVNGPVENQAWKAGQVAWSPAGGEYTGENVGDQVLRAIEIELKPSLPLGKPFVVSPFDPVKVDSKHYWVEFENSKVRVIHGKYMPYESGAEHMHSNNRAVIYLIKEQTEVTTRDGKLHVLNPPVDSVWWSGTARHRDTAGKNPIEMVVIEPK